MASRIQQARLQTFAASIEESRVIPVEQLREIFEEHRHRIYSLAFWMTDNELTAEQISARVFGRAFDSGRLPSREQVDRCLVRELCEITNLGVLTLAVDSMVAKPVRGNIKRIHMERAVVQVPATERLAFLLHDVEGYAHDRIANMLGITRDESVQAVHQARMLMRELIAEMN